MKKAIILFFLLHLVFLVSAQDRFRFFTPERKELCQRMGAFFDETIKNNFPSEADSLSYKAFLKCLTNSQSKYKHLILFVDKEKLNEINQELFKNKNYYFFYARDVYERIENQDSIPVIARKKSLSDTVPTIRHGGKFTPDVYLNYQYKSYLNYDGYIERINQLPDTTGIVKAVKYWLEYARHMGPMVFLIYYQNHLKDLSDPLSRELGAVLFWNYLCYCANIDFEERKSMCCDD